MIADKNRVFDGWTSLAGGQDDGREPNLIDLDQAAKLENFVCRGGSATVRPGIARRPAIFKNNVSYNANGDRSNVTGSIHSVPAFRTHVFQGASYYSSGDTECFMAMIGGRYFKVKPTLTGCEVTEIPLPRRNNRTLPLAYMVQADKFHIVQDGESRAIIFDGVNARRAASDEMPVGTVMAYGMLRLIVVKGRNIYFGDIYNGRGNGGDDVLKFIETTFLNEGFPSALPAAMGVPTAAAFYPQQDTAMGQGELIVFGENGAETFYVSIKRDLWKDSPFQRSLLLGIGAHGHRDVADVNSDLWFRSTDGRRSFRQARAEVNQWTQIPLSTPVRTFTDADTQWLLGYGSSIHFNNRLICTCTPQPNQANIPNARLYHRGLLCLDFDILSSFGRNLNPAWNGHWYSPMKVLQLIKGVFNKEERAFAFGIDTNGDNALFEITKTDADDFSGPIPFEIVSRRMEFQTPMEEKKLWGGDIWVDDVRSSTTFSVEFRSDDRQDWTPWHNYAAINETGTPGAITPGGIPTARAAYRPRKRLPTPTEECDPVTKRFLRQGYEFQTRITGTGHCRIRKQRLHAKPVLEESKGDCS